MFLNKTPALVEISTCRKKLWYIWGYITVTYICMCVRKWKSSKNRTGKQSTKSLILKSFRFGHSRELICWSDNQVDSWSVCQSGTLVPPLVISLLTLWFACWVLYKNIGQFVSICLFLSQSIGHFVSSSVDQLLHCSITNFVSLFYIFWYDLVCTWECVYCTVRYSVGWGSWRVF